jgi:hypothetical protein
MDLVTIFQGGVNTRPITCVQVTPKTKTSPFITSSLLLQWDETLKSRYHNNELNNSLHYMYKFTS